MKRTETRLAQPPPPTPIEIKGGPLGPRRVRLLMCLGAVSLTMAAAAAAAHRAPEPLVGLGAPSGAGTIEVGDTIYQCDYWAYTSSAKAAPSVVYFRCVLPAKPEGPTA